MTFFDPWFSISSWAFYLCPADKPPDWNIAWTSGAGSGTGIHTNELPYSNSYHYYHQFDDSDKIPAAKMRQRRTTEVSFPSRKAIISCYPEPRNSQVGKRNLAHGGKEGALLFADNHAGYTRYVKLYKAAAHGDSNLDWTRDELKGMDLK